MRANLLYPSHTHYWRESQIHCTNKHSQTSPNEGSTIVKDNGNINIKSNLYLTNDSSRPPGSFLHASRSPKESRNSLVYLKLGLNHMKKWINKALQTNISINNEIKQTSQTSLLPRQAFSFNRGFQRLFLTLILQTHPQRFKHKKNTETLTSRQEQPGNPNPLFLKQSLNHHSINSNISSN